MSLSTFYTDPPSTKVGLETRKRPVFDGSPRYKILEVHPPQKDGEDTYVRIQIKGTRSSFLKSLTSIYTEDWLPFFSMREASRLGELFVAQKNNSWKQIRSNSHWASPITRNVVILAIFFIATLLLSNILAFKLTWLHLGTLHLGAIRIPLNFQCDAAFFIFPLTFYINNVLTEVYGFKITRLVIGASFVTLLFAGIAVQIAIALPSSPLWEHQESFTTVLSSSWRIFIASSIAFISGSILNALILSRLKILTHGKHLWFRATTSTFFGALVDTTLLFYIGFLGPLPRREAFGFIALGMAIKMTCELALIPFTYWLSNHLKRVDTMDAY
jgi:hypothetical protein